VHRRDGKIPVLTARFLIRRPTAASSIFRSTQSSADERHAENSVKALELAQQHCVPRAERPASIAGPSVAGRFEPAAWHGVLAGRAARKR
jgi:hypothetical protein